MSTHLLIAAAYVEDLDPTVKLVLMAVADSADEHTLEAAPGLPKLRAWSGRSKSQALRIVEALEAAGYLARVEAGRAGRRAVYRVFPAGVPAIPHPDEVRDRYVVPNGDNPESYPQDDAAQGRTHATLRVASEASRVAPMRPLQSSTSVSMGSSSPQSTGPGVDRPTTTSRPSHPRSGFPGAQWAREDGTPAPRSRNEGPPCPYHPDNRVPCPSCAAAAVAAEDAAATIAEARRAITANRTATREDRPA